MTSTARRGNRTGAPRQPIERGDDREQPLLHLWGRDQEIAELKDTINQEQSVMLWGPGGVGKSALARTVAKPEVVLLDPFAHVSRLEAHRIMRLLDRGRVALATTRGCSRHEIGAVGRILWRFRRVRIGPLHRSWIRLIVRDGLTAAAIPPSLLGPSWWTEAEEAARGLPGLAVAIAAGTASAFRATGRIQAPYLSVLDHEIEDLLISTRKASGNDDRNPRRTGSGTS